MAALALNWRVWVVLGALFGAALLRRLWRQWRQGRRSRRAARRDRPAPYGSKRPYPPR